MTAAHWALLGMMSGLLGVMVAGFLALFAVVRTDRNALRIEIGRLDTKIDAGLGRLESKIDAGLGRLEGRIGSLEVRIGRLEARIDAQTARIDHLTERMDEHLRTHSS